MSLRPLAAECRDTEACPFQILTRFTQPHRLRSWSQPEICQNLDSNSAATLGPRAQVNYARTHNAMENTFSIPFGIFYAKSEINKKTLLCNPLMGCAPFTNSCFQMGFTVMGSAKHFGHYVKFNFSRGFKDPLKVLP